MLSLKSSEANKLDFLHRPIHVIPRPFYAWNQQNFKDSAVEWKDRNMKNNFSDFNLIKSPSRIKDDGVADKNVAFSAAETKELAVRVDSHRRKRDEDEGVQQRYQGDSADLNQRRDVRDVEMCCSQSKSDELIAVAEELGQHSERAVCANNEFHTGRKLPEAACGAECCKQIRTQAADICTRSKSLFVENQLHVKHSKETPYDVDVMAEIDSEMAALHGACHSRRQSKILNTSESLRVTTSNHSKTSGLTENRTHLANRTFLTIKSDDVPTAVLQSSSLADKQSPLKIKQSPCSNSDIKRIIDAIKHKISSDANVSSCSSSSSATACRRELFRLSNSNATFVVNEDEIKKSSGCSSRVLHAKTTAPLLCSSPNSTDFPTSRKSASAFDDQLVEGQVSKRRRRKDLGHHSDRCMQLAPGDVAEPPVKRNCSRPAARSDLRQSIAVAAGRREDSVLEKTCASSAGDSMSGRNSIVSRPSIADAVRTETDVKNLTWQEYSDDDDSSDASIHSGPSYKHAIR